MLLLTRKVGEDIVIGNDTVISVERIADNRVQIRVYAPKDIMVNRGEKLSELDLVCLKQAIQDGRVLRANSAKPTQNF